MKTLIAIITFNLLQSLPAQAGLAKSTTCLSLLQMVKQASPASTPEQQYILNSLTGLAEFISKKPLSAIEPNVSEGRITSSKYSSGFSPVQAAGRLRGIHDFANKPSDTESGDRRFTMMTSVSGKDQITNFLRQLVDTSNWSSNFYKGMVIRSWQSPITAAIATGLLHAIDKLNVVNGTVIGLAGSISVESTARYAMLHTNGLKGQLEEINDQVKVFEKGTWMLRSMNFEIQKDLLEDALKYQFDKPWQLSNQEPIDYSSRIAETVLMPFLKFFKPELANGYRRDANARKNKSWVGIDFYLTTAQDGEPELQIIIRGTHKAPPYPKTSPKPKESKQEDRVLAPGQVGVPVRY